MAAELGLSLVGGGAGGAALIVAALAFCGAGEAAVAAGGGGGARGPLTVSVPGAAGAGVVSPVEGAVSSGPMAALSLLEGPSIAVDGSDDVEHVPDVVAAASAPSLLFVAPPNGASASVAPPVHELSVVADEESAAASVVSAVVTSVEGDDVSVDEIEVALSGSALVASEGVSDAPAVASGVCTSPVTTPVTVLASVESLPSEASAV